MDITPGGKMRTKLMGILNVTPDSFHDGGRYLDPEAAIERGLQLVIDGADIIDIGGESTRPGSHGVDAATELARVVPVIRGLREKTSIPISIDTRKSAVAKAALDAGADIVNDISGLRDDTAMAGLVAGRSDEVVIMHTLGDPSTMQDNPVYDDVVDDINSFFRERLDYSTSKGIDASNIVLDPGIGFGKTLEHNLEIIRRFDEFAVHGVRTLIGPSNKSFIRRVLNEPEDARLEGTIAACIMAVVKGADMVRVHDVAPVRRALRLTEAILDGKTGD
jgi:dihydropteroate synthase